MTLVQDKNDKSTFHANKSQFRNAPLNAALFDFGVKKIVPVRVTKYQVNVKTKKGFVTWNRKSPDNQADPSRQWYYS